MNNNCAILIPIYKNELDNDEKFSINYSIPKISNHDIYWVAPEDIDEKYYVKNFKLDKFSKFNNEYFKDIKGYNKLLTSKEFYIEFINYKYILIFQPDALIIKDNLKYWIAQDYDYIGAPWPQGFSLPLNIDSLPLNNKILCTSFVGNGGLSLRKTESCINLINEFPNLSKEWREIGHAEDLFFSFLGNYSLNYRIPNIFTAANFSHDIDPVYLHNLIGNKLPFGVHAWSKYNRKFWEETLNLPPEIRALKE